MKIAAIIPVRYYSTRFKGKPLALISGKTMIERVYGQVKRCKYLSDVIVATDHSKIAQEVERFGGNYVYTSIKHNSGTERLWEVLEKSDFEAAINIQGDEPVISENLISQLYLKLKTGQFQVITAVYFNDSYQEYLSRNVVKAVVSKTGQALYFSRSPIPFVEKDDFSGFYQHIGIYGYLKSTLKSVIDQPISKLEEIEKLEQLRFLENDIPVYTIESKYPAFGVDVPEDIKKIEKIIERKKHP
jgi:3-deoxy-manno-octulosonate cytidylyltransferase (CMP-KDO synthetase)